MLLPTSKKARLSADSLKKSLKIKDNEARKVLALMFDYDSWDQFIRALPKSEPLYEPIAIDATNNHLAHKLAFALELPVSDEMLNLIKSISPFSKKPKAYRVDLNDLVHGKESESAFEFGQMREMMKTMHPDGDESVMAYLNEMVANSGDPGAQELLNELKKHS